MQKRIRSAGFERTEEKIIPSIEEGPKKNRSGLAKAN